MEEATEIVHDGGGQIYVRQVTSMCRTLDVRPRMKKRYAFKDYPSEFKYRCKCIIVFQNLDGVDVILFGLYVYEHDETNAPPNQRTVYVSYLDSVHYMRPRRMRTFVYHELLTSYLDYVRMKGYNTAHIWACPPLKGDDYILFAKPEDQKIPKDDRLRQWYVDMLKECQRRGIVGRMTNAYDLYFATGKHDATILPYMEGDYFPAEMENIIKDMEEGKNLTKKPDKASKKGKKEKKKKAKAGARGGTRSNPLDQELLSASGIVPEGFDVKSIKEGGRDWVMKKLGETIHPMKESFLVAYLNSDGQSAENLVVPKDIMEYREKHGIVVGKPALEPIKEEDKMDVDGEEDSKPAAATEESKKEESGKTDTEAAEESKKDEGGTEETKKGGDDKADAESSPIKKEPSEENGAAMEVEEDNKDEEKDGSKDTEVKVKMEESTTEEVNVKEEPTDDEGDGKEKKDAPVSNGQSEEASEEKKDEVELDDKAKTDETSEEKKDDAVEEKKDDAAETDDKATEAESGESTVKTEEGEAANVKEEKKDEKEEGKAPDDGDAAAAAGGDTKPSETPSTPAADRGGKFAAMAKKKEGDTPEADAKSDKKPEDAKSNKTPDEQSSKSVTKDSKGRIVKIIEDDEEEMDCEFLNNRQLFLNLCQGNHYQFDSLRRAKHTSMMVLWHLHNRDAPKFVQQCAICAREILQGKRYHCPTCADFDQCIDCLRNPAVPRHPHQLQAIPVGSQQSTLTPEQRKERQRSIALHMTLLLHASTCRSSKCTSANCAKMKGLLKHGAGCKIKANGGCNVCKRIWALLQIHARQCKKENCPVPNCMAIRERYRQLQLQQQAMDDRRREMMNQTYHQQAR